MSEFGFFIFVFAITVILGVGYQLTSAIIRSSPRRMDGHFATEIREKLPFLFSEHSATIVRNEPGLPRTMGASYVTIEAENLRFQFLTGRGDLTVKLAPRHAPAEWDELSLVAMAIETPQGIRARERIGYLEDVAKLLRAHWSSLNEALSVEQYPATRQRLDAVYDLPNDVLWNAGILIPQRLRTGSRAPLPLPRRH
jgi:hypothetical protein